MLSPLDGASGQAAEMTEKEVDLFIDLVYKVTSIRMSRSKKALLMNRLHKRVKALGLGTYLNYHKFLTESPRKNEEMPFFIDAVTTNETYFFRTPKVWDYFQKTFLPQWWAKNKGTGPLKIWSAATSSGEEPYTIAIVCQDFAQANPGFSWQFKGSDISGEMMAKSKEGRYQGRSLMKVDKAYLSKYFEELPGQVYAVKESLKKNMSFFLHNLKNPPPTKGFDIIFIRNVMIYFDQPTKELILKHMEDSLKTDGVLILGESEGLISPSISLKYIMPSIYSKQK